MNVNEFFQKDWNWLAEIAITICVTIVISLLLQKFLSIWQRRAEKSEVFWKKKIGPIFRIPLQIAVWGIGLLVALQVIFVHFEWDTFFPYFGGLQATLLVLCTSWMILRWIKAAFNHLALKSEKLGVSSTTLYTLNKFSTFIILVLTLLIIFPLFGLSTLPLLTFGGIGMAATAFAAQDMIANFFGGIMLHFTRIFSIGEYVSIPKENFEGTIKEIGWHTTLIEDPEHRLVYFPNGLFFKSGVINDTRRSHRRLQTMITIRYEDFQNIEKIISDLREKIFAHPEVDSSQGNKVVFSDFGSSGLEISVEVYLYSMGLGKFLSIKQEVLLIISQVVYKYGAAFCYPTTNVNLRQALNP